MRLPERIETERLTLRRLGPGDRDALLAVWRDPQVWAALQPGRPFDASAAAGGAAMTRLRLPCLISLISPENDRSRAVARRLGMERADTVEHRPVGWELDMYVIARQRWRA